MKIEKFVNHIYYSYASIDRFITFNSIDIGAKENAVYTATTTLSIALSGYIIGLLYTICQLFCYVSDLRWSKNILFSIAIFSALILPLCLRMVKNDIYKKYFSEFRNNPNYKHIQWHIISILFFAIGVSVDIFVLTKGF
jgi:hypothetical protein